MSIPTLSQAPPRKSVRNRPPTRWASIRLLSLLISAGSLAGCITVSEGERDVRPRVGPPSERVEAPRLPSNAQVEADCDFDRIRPISPYGMGGATIRVRCPKEDIARFFAVSRYAGGPAQGEDPPEVRIRLRFEPTAMPTMDRCAGSGQGIPAPIPVVRRFDPTQVAFSTREIGAIAEIEVMDEEGGRRVFSGVGYALGLDCGPLEFTRAAEDRYLAGLSKRIGEAMAGALESALFDRAIARPDFEPAPAPAQPVAVIPGIPMVPASTSVPETASTSRPRSSSSGAAAEPALRASPSEELELPAGGFGRYSALVIGVDEYDHLPSLGNALGDARAVGAVLREDYGYRVQELANPTRAEVLKALVEIRRRLDENDNLLIYYAGHGWLDEDADEGYWLPSDADRADPTNWISNDTITAQLRAIRARHVMVVADSCYSGKLVRGIKVGPRPSDHYARMAARRARVVLSSGGLEPVVDSGGQGGHSVFAAAFLDALRSNESVVDGATIFARLRRPVMTNADQIPEYSDIRLAGHDGGDFLFVRKGVE